ncbi:hypothetical protein BDZ85DRAFT_282339 [Elsinoe ampelina]|uniref:Uncharacterized protein n=1 Tax=Elsinoe ampelina TaxID=302913 RepID=A0A6A6G917_9PEZI|nr:hypothetical protein BDZ85DRAFT_282339 [Elsinoe ampelina]
MVPPPRRYRIGPSEASRKLPMFQIPRPAVRPRIIGPRVPSVLEQHSANVATQLWIEANEAQARRKATAPSAPAETPQGAEQVSAPVESDKGEEQLVAAVRSLSISPKAQAAQPARPADPPQQSRPAPRRNKEVDNLGTWFPPNTTADGHYAAQFPDSALQIYSQPTLIPGHPPKPQHTGSNLIQSDGRATRQTVRQNTESQAARAGVGSATGTSAVSPPRFRFTLAPRPRSDQSSTSVADTATTDVAPTRSVLTLRLGKRKATEGSDAGGSEPPSNSKRQKTGEDNVPLSQPWKGKRKATGEGDAGESGPSGGGKRQKTGGNDPSTSQPNKGKRQVDDEDEGESENEPKRARRDPSSSPSDSSSSSDDTDTTQRDHRHGDRLIVVLPAFISPLDTAWPQRNRFKPELLFTIPFAVGFRNGRVYRLRDPANPDPDRITAPRRVARTTPDFQIYTAGQRALSAAERREIIAQEPDSPLSVHSFDEDEEPPLSPPLYLDGHLLQPRRYPPWHLYRFRRPSPEESASVDGGVPVEDAAIVQDGSAVEEGHAIDEEAPIEDGPPAVQEDSVDSVSANREQDRPRGRGVRIELHANGEQTVYDADVESSEDSEDGNDDPLALAMERMKLRGPSHS